MLNWTRRRLTSIEIDKWFWGPKCELCIEAKSSRITLFMGVISKKNIGWVKVASTVRWLQQTYIGWIKAVSSVHRFFNLGDVVDGVLLRCRGRGVGIGSLPLLISNMLT